MKDLSGLAADSMWPTSQAGGNMTASSAQAMTAPGSPPVDPLPPAEDQGHPHVVATAEDGRRTEHGQPGGAADWTWDAAGHFAAAEGRHPARQFGKGWDG